MQLVIDAHQRMDCLLPIKGQIPQMSLRVAGWSLGYAYFMILRRDFNFEIRNFEVGI